MDRLVPLFVFGEKWRFGDTNTKLVLMTSGVRSVKELWKGTE